jgi:hypothetical protein
MKYSIGPVNIFVYPTPYMFITLDNNRLEWKYTRRDIKTSWWKLTHDRKFHYLDHSRFTCAETPFSGFLLEFSTRSLHSSGTNISQTTCEEPLI